MDAVELPFSVEVSSATKLIGSVAVKELEACTSFISEKTAVHAISASEVTSWNKIIDPEPRNQNNQLPRRPGEAFSAVFHDQCNNGFLPTPKAEGVQLERKAGKVSRSSGTCHKRPRVIQLQDPPQVGVDGINDMSQKFGSCTLKCSSSEKQLVKQKNNLTNRGDKRSPRVPVKTKHDSFSVKAGLTCFGSAAGGNNFFGNYGLKSDNHDAAKLIDDVPLNELLDGNYKSPSLGKDKGKKIAVGNESFLHSLRKSCSILQVPRSIQSRNMAETDSCSNKKMAPWLLSSSSVEANGVNGDIGDSSTADISSSSKDTVIGSETPANPLELPLYQPFDILQRLALPPPKDLESLLLDAAKPPLSSKNTPDMRLGKQVARRVSLPPFPWSNASSGHCRSNSDVVKLSTTKGTCQGRWLRIEKNTSSLGIVTSEFTDLESLTYDKGLVPSGLKVTCLDNEISPKLSTSLAGRESDSIASCSKGSCVTLVSGGKAIDTGNAGNSPKLLAAAQTLYDIATRSPRHNLDRLIRWPKKSSQKAMKARKLKSNEKTEELHATSGSALRLENLARSEDSYASKKPKLSHPSNKRDLNYLRKEAINWSAPRSSRSSPGKTVKDSIATDMRYSTVSVVKQSYMMPPPPMRVPENALNSQQKLRKLMPLEWNRGRDRLN